MINNINLINEDVCTGCSACYNSCPFDAILMVTNAEGFLYPKINIEKCINCGLCYQKCPAKDEINKSSEPIKVYAGQCNNKDLLMKSASGGIFAAVASYVLENEGIVFGCYQDDKFNVKHVSIKNKDELHKLQGSKYVQSDVNKTYNEAREYLLDGKIVLYSGTPCQIDGLNRYLGIRYDNLLTIDLVCHGVGSNQYYKDYLEWYKRKKNIKIIDYKFRTKKRNFMTCEGELTYIKRGKLINKPIYYDIDIYYSQYMKGLIYRKSCYYCRYANRYRISDFTVGDYWGIECEHPEIKLVNGVSAILVNNEKGISILKNADISLYESEFSKASKFNGNLKQPTKISIFRNKIFDCYIRGGFEEVAKHYGEKMHTQKLVRYMKNIVPISYKRKLKNVLKGKNNE